MINFILEGIDKSGKTTIANYLKDKYNFKIVKCSQPKKGEDVYKTYMKMLRDIKVNTVFDRFNLGELVYGPLFRGKSMIDEQKMRNIEMLALAKNTKIIYCYDTPEKIIKRFEKDGEKFVSPNQIKSILAGYKSVLAKSILPVYHHVIKDFDILPNRLGEILDDDINVIGGHEIIGSCQQPILLVGEKRNTLTKYRDVQVPFDFGPSSEYLYQRLQKIGPLSDFAITNCTSKSIKKFVELTNPKEIIALGKEASQVLTKLKVDHQQLNHPSYERRFHPKSNKFYLNLKKIYDNLR